MPGHRSLRRALRALTGICAVAALGFAAVMAVGGYFDDDAYALVGQEAGNPSGRATPAFGVVYWSGDMGMRVGTGERVVDDLVARGFPVLTVSSPVLFGAERDRAFVDAAVARSLSLALFRTHASKLVVIGNSFGADIVGAGLAHLPAGLRQKIASVVLLVPSADIYFHANPAGFYYRGPVAASSASLLPLLRGLPVTCIYGRTEDASLCRSSGMAGASKVEIDDGHLMLWSRRQLADVLLSAATHPPRPMT